MDQKKQPIRRSGDIDVYTGLLCAAFLVMAVGAALLALNNIEHSADDRQPGGIFTLVDQQRR
jgi:hypothetical protein